MRSSIIILRTAAWMPLLMDKVDKIDKIDAINVNAPEHRAV